MKRKNDLLFLPAKSNYEEIIEKISTPLNFIKGQYRNLEFRFKNNRLSLVHLGVDIKEFPNVWLSSNWRTRDLAYAVYIYLDHFKTHHTYVEKATSKITDQVFFTLNNISTPSTFFIDNQDISEYVETIEDVCGYPLIIKDTTGSLGKHSVYVSNRIELLEKSKKLPKHKKFLYQKFIPNDYDWGVLVANGKVVSAEKSYPKTGEFRNNLCNGAREVYMEIKSVPAEIKEMALKASKALDLSWSRSDIIVDRSTGTPYLMEVNRFPGVCSGTMEVSGAQEFLEDFLGLSGPKRKSD
jgi:hypothetical protein